MSDQIAVYDSIVECELFRCDRSAVAEYLHDVFTGDATVTYVIDSLQRAINTGQPLQNFQAYLGIKIIPLQRD